MLGNRSDWGGTCYGVGDVNFNGFYTSPTSDASWKHLDGAWAVNNGTLDFVKDFKDGRHEVRSNGNYLREVQF